MEDQDLTLVGLTEDKSRLVLVSAAGEKFTLPADDALRAALRGDHARPGELETKMESALRPRDIQARIRAGETPESVAAAAQTTIDKIMGYATPVLAERAHIADRAQRASVRRKGGEGSSRLLGDAVASVLRERNVDPESVAWDAWRREDGRWTLVADFDAGAGAKRAEFVFDAPGRYVVAEDDEARILVGEAVAAKPPARGSGSGRRLSAVGSADEELPLGEDAIELVNEPPAAAGRQSEAAKPSPEPSPHGDELLDARGDADWMATQATDRPARTSRPEDEPADERPADAAGEAPAAATEPEPAPEPAPEAEPEPVRKPARKNRGRASVPSWDEIMFGGGKQE
ncbi:MAG: septation protein SepH [Nocardioides sp.]